MKISQAILGRHLHEAAIEQLASTLNDDGYEVRRDARVGYLDDAPTADLVARRGNDFIVYEVKILGERSPRSAALAAQAARDVGAKFHMVLVNPQRRVSIELEGAPDLVLRAFHDAGPAPLAAALERLDAEWRPVRVSGVELDNIALSGGGTEVSGSAVLTLQQPGVEAPKNDPWHDPREWGVHLPVRFTLWLDQDRRFTQPPRLDVDISELDA